MVNAKAGITWLAVWLALMIFPALSWAQGDPERGALLYRECAPCHSLYREGRQAGPPLRGVFGRQAGTVPEFSYSDAMQNSGILWTDETLKAWLSDPLTFIPGSRKRGHSVWREERLDDILAYLKRAQGLLKDSGAF